MLDRGRAAASLHKGRQEELDCSKGSGVRGRPRSSKGAPRDFRRRASLLCLLPRTSAAPLSVQAASSLSGACRTRGAASVVARSSLALFPPLFLARPKIMSKALDTTEKTATYSTGGDEPNEAVVGYMQAQIGPDSTDDELLAYIIDPAEEKALLRRLDSFIAPMVAILYLISFRESLTSPSSASLPSSVLPRSLRPVHATVDRSNVGNAATGGMFDDINAPSNGLSLATSLFYCTVSSPLTFSSRSSSA